MNQGKPFNGQQETKLLERVAALEKRVEELARLAILTADHTADVWAGLLTGWDQIESFCGKKRRTLSRYAKNMEFPALRWGRNVCSSPALITRWLLVVHTMKRQGKEERGLSALSDIELNERLTKLDEQLKR